MSTLADFICAAYRLEPHYRNSCGNEIEAVVSIPRVWSFIDIPLWFPMLRSIDNSVQNSVQFAAGDWDAITFKVKKSVRRSMCS